MAEEAQLCFLARSLAVELDIRIGSRRMGFIRAPFPLEVCLGIAPAILRRITRAIFGLEALHGRPGLNQGAVNREVVGRGQLLHLGLGQNGSQELGRGVTDEEPIAALGGGRVILGGIIKAEPDELAKQRVIVEPLHQLALGANGEGLLGHGPKRRLQWGGGRPMWGAYEAVDSR
jgi:hypothetical protein